jgi:hypothetical protein
MKLKHLLYASIIAAGCGGAKTEDPAAKTGAGDKTQPAVPAKVAIPESDLTLALKLIGAPFEKSIEYKVKGFPTGETNDTRTFTVDSVDGGVVKLHASWAGTLAQYGTEDYESDKSGVRAVKVFGNPVEPPFVYLPIDAAPGKTWSSKYTIVALDGTKIAFDITAKFLAREKVTVPAGTYDALVLEESGTGKGTDIEIKQTGKTYLVEGVGVVKVVNTQTGKAKGTTLNNNIQLEAVALK